jgi:hypothetical protein
MARTAKLEQRIQIGLFVLFLALPAIDWIFDLDTTPRPPNQARAPLPRALSRSESFAAWRDGVEAYVGDSFGWRSWAVRSFHRLNYRLFRVSEQPFVVVGKRGWLFYGGAAAYHRATRPFSDEEREEWSRSFERRREWLDRLDIHYLFMIAPNKHSIYPEHLPGRLRRTGRASRYEQLVEDLRPRRAGRSWIDLHGPLTRAKSSEVVYERTGTHWNLRGAYEGYRVVFERLRAHFPQLEPVPWERVETESGNQGEMPRVLGLEPLFPESLVRPVGGVRYPRPRMRRMSRLVTEQDDPELPRAVVFHDSFGLQMIPFLAEHFSYAVFQWGTRFDGELILAVQPDVVIDERVERELTLTPFEDRLPVIPGAARPQPRGRRRR